MQILLADDHVLFRDGMRYVLQQISDQVDILCAGNFNDAIKVAEDNPRLDLALLDLHMPASNGVSSIRIFHDRFPLVPLVVISGSDQLTEIECAMEYGAMGFISKMTPAKAMVNALRVVLSGDIYFPPELLNNSDKQELPNSINDTDDSNDRFINKNVLTKRQMEALQYLAEGLSNKEIAIRMKLAEGTVKVHVAAAFQILQVSSRVDAVRKAQRLGLIQLDNENL